MQVAARLRAAWAAFRDPSRLDPPAPVVLIGVGAVPSADVPPNTGTRFRVVRHHAGTDTLLYPIRPGQDHGREARDVFLASQPTLPGETITFWDHADVRGRSAC